MKTSDVVKFFGSKIKIAQALGIHKSTVTNWGDEVPKSRQYELQVITKGALKAEQTAA